MNTTNEHETTRIKTGSRASNIDLLRLLCMAMIVVMHFYSHSGVWSAIPADSLLLHLSRLLCRLSAVAVNTFVLITGYFGGGKKSFSRAFQVTAKTWCFSVLLAAAGSALHVLRPNAGMVLRTLLPISTKLYWFMTAYVGMILLSPFLNLLLQRLGLRLHRVLLLLLFCLFCLVQYVYPPADAFQVGKGYSLIWFLFLYLTGAYIARLPRERGKAGGKYALLYFGLILAAFAGETLLRLFQGEEVKKAEYIRFFTDYSSPFCYLAAISLFRAFAAHRPAGNTRFGGVVSRLARYTLGVYLIHENPYLRTTVWTKIFEPAAHASSPELFLYLLGCVTVIFAAGLAAGALVDAVLAVFLRVSGLSKALSKLDDSLAKILSESEAGASEI